MLGFRRMPFALAFEIDCFLDRNKCFALGRDDSAARILDRLLKPERTKSPVARPDGVDGPRNRLGKAGVLPASNFRKMNRRQPVVGGRLHGPFRGPALGLALA